MKKQAGLWIDHREAFVAFAEGDQEARRLESGMEKHTRFTGGNRPEDGSPEDRRDRNFTEHLNRYYDEVGRVIAEHDGHIDNYMGDGLLAVFGMERPAHSSRRAVAAARGMIAAVERLKPYFEAVYGRSFDIGIGIHYGEVIVGAVGAAGRRRVTIVGDAVNAAARVEAATKTLGVRVLISSATFNELDEPDAAWSLHRVALPGKSGQFVLYEMKS